MTVIQHLLLHTEQFQFMKASTSGRIQRPLAMTGLSYEHILSLISRRLVCHKVDGLYHPLSSQSKKQTQTHRQILNSPPPQLIQQYTQNSVCLNENHLQIISIQPFFQTTTTFCSPLVLKRKPNRHPCTRYYYILCNINFWQIINMLVPGSIVKSLIHFFMCCCYNITSISYLYSFIFILFLKTVAQAYVQLHSTRIQGCI